MNNKKFLPLAIVNGVHFALLSLFIFIYSVSSIITAYRLTGAYGTMMLFVSLSLVFLYIATTIMSFFVLKHKKLAIPVAAFSIFAWGVELAQFIYVCSSGSAPVGIVIFYLYEFFTANVVLALSIVLVCVLKAFGREYYYQQYPNYNYYQNQPPMSQYYPQQGYPQPQYQQPYPQPQYQQPYPQQPQPQYQQPYPQQGYPQPAPQPQQNYPAQEAAPVEPSGEPNNQQ